MTNVCLDANIFIDAYNKNIPRNNEIKKIFQLAENRKIKVFVSLQTLTELEKKDDEALQLARTIPTLPHWPIGTWNEQVGTWKEQEGTWNDAKQNDRVQLKLKDLAKAGNDIRDRGAFIDTLKSNMDYFVTSDGQLVKKGPQKRINNSFQTKVVKPKDLLGKLNL